MFRRFALLFLLLLIVFTHYSQRHNETPDYFSIYRTAEKFYTIDQPNGATDSLALLSYEKVILILRSNHANDSILFDSYLKAGILQMSNNNDRSAIDLFLSAISTREISKRKDDSLLFKPFLFAGSSYYNLNNLDSASYCYKKAEDLINTNPTISESERLYNKSGALYYETGDYKKSIQYFSKALSIVEKNKSSNPYFIVNYKNNIASALRKLGEYKQAMGLYKSLLPYHINQNELLHNIGVTYLANKDFDSAIAALKQVKYNGQAKYNDIGYAYLQLKKFDSSKYYLNKSQSEYERKSSTLKNIDFGITLKYFGDMMTTMGDPAKGLTYYQRAIIQIDPDFNDTGLCKNPESFNGLHNSFLLFDALTAKAKAFNQLSNLVADSAALTCALSSFESAILLASKTEKTFTSDEAKFFLGNTVDDAYKDVIDLALRLYELKKDKAYLDKAFSYAENSKASVLQSSLHELSLDSIEGLPHALIRQERNVKALITKLNIELGTTTDSIAAKRIQLLINDRAITLSTIQSKLDEDPRYHQLKFDSRSNSIDSLQKKILHGDDALISFYFLQNRLICFFITREDYGYINYSLKGDLQKNILTLRQMFSAGEGRQSRSISDLSGRIYEELMESVIGKIKNKSHLLIIPHNEISYLPFEAIADPKTNQFLLRKFSISYNYSANFIGRDQRVFNRPYNVLAMAPFTGTGNPGDNNLQASLTEVSSLKGKVFSGNEATKQNFLENASEYPVIHLATHAVANDADPLRSYISFFGATNSTDTAHQLYEQEIYHLDIKSTRLVILSACETGAGQLVNGEGIMSLSRAFSYAGCKSVIASLWKADDAATAFIATRLHVYLQRGLQKDKALQKAKLDYLESDEVDPTHKTPAYWAHLVLIGNAQAIEKKNGGHLWIAAIAVLLLLLTWLIGNHKRI